MQKKYELKNCDILDINGHILLVYEGDKDSRQKVLVYAKSYRDLNEKSMNIFGGEDWMDFLFYMDEKFSGDLIDRLLADMYARYNDTYMSVFKKWNSELQDDTQNIDEDDHNKDGKFVFSMTENDKATEDGHHLANLDKDSISKLPTRLLMMLADAFHIENFDLMSRGEMLTALSETDVDIDEQDDEECCDCDDVNLTMKVVRTDKDGHRWAAFNKEDIEKLDNGMLCALAEDMEIPNYDLKGHAELVDAICAEESDIDSDEYDCTDDCDGNCDCCEYAGIDDRNKDETSLPDFHDTGKHDKTGRSIYKYNRNELEQLNYEQLYDLICMFDIDLGIDADDLVEREDLIDALCDLTCLVDEGHDDWLRPIATEDEIKCDETSQYEAPQYESVNGPQHYNGTECIENMRKIYGDDAVR